ncbi:hypothetical protein [Pedobacter insulae]|uniref:Uncharacterized protein n=1 Tax=Pedobacter insulae TaxID=414048 RepID=A0A1I2TN90_9SPHI|nr:hypothetical protein [Pedobacter insulae]SFG63906.1 hypothetical protein SAMN04489864_101396 [Pedobacter insulae]
MILIAKWVVVLFGLFLICIGLLMLFAPQKARETLRKAGSTNFINYAEITFRMIPAAGIIIYSDYSRFPEIFKIFGWFMLATSGVLYLVPRRIHHAFSMSAADVLKPLYFRLLSPLTLLFGVAVIYCVI